ncbi:DUF7673 family protein [Herminiimonas contaminans]|uniref:DUF7673 domain-containing protein n=1 Tax=Herminiimonas contaminans TaxID=1111140 RepID=A0ABS0EQ15_9BURK|nr:hypothetical protein [Herminiimonas contaminans]MBF8176950.1 hypothetical protein [Herminiimonas contaminans]
MDKTSKKILGAPAVGQEDKEQAAAIFQAAREEREQAQKALPNIRRDGRDALVRLVNIARGDSGQCRHVAVFLLSLYNGSRFKFDLTDFRCLDKSIFDDCMAVLKMDRTPAMEVHMYFENGGEIWEQLARDWLVPDRRKLRLALCTASFTGYDKEQNAINEKLVADYLASRAI